jgi:hypothetical protein
VCKERPVASARAREAQRDRNREQKNCDEIMTILAQAKALAQRYRALTGKPLGITGEVAEFEAARLLDLQLTPARNAGYDAVRQRKREMRLSIKGRCLLPDGKPGQRMGKIDITKEFDAVLLVLMDDSFNATAIWEAGRKAVIDALIVPGSKARNERGALGLAKFKAIGKRVWPVAKVD